MLLSPNVQACLLCDGKRNERKRSAHDNLMNYSSYSTITTDETTLIQNQLGKITLAVSYCKKGFLAITADYKRLRVKTRNFVFLPNVTRTLLFHKLLTTSEHTMNIEIISFYVSKECKNMQSLLQLSSVVVGLISELGQSDQTRENVGVGKAISM